MAIPIELRKHLLHTSGGELGVHSDEDAYRFCRRLAFRHYENFPVASLILGSLRDDVAAIYAFARLADDIADELTVPSEEKLRLLTVVEQWLENAPTSHPIARALQITRVRRGLPLEPFHRLLAAFRYDAAFRPFATEQELLSYCRYSAAPIGELLLRLVGEWNDATAPHSDAFCAGLQVLNFWQDAAIDLRQQRCTIPLEWMPDRAQWQLTDELDQQTRKAISLHFDIVCAQLLPRGLLLMNHLVQRRLRIHLRATWEAARRVWLRCQQRSFHWEFHPRLRWYDVAGITLRALFV